MTWECLWLLHRGLNSTCNDIVTKNKDIYSSLTTANYCQECTDFSYLDCSSSLSFGKKKKLQKKGKKQIGRWIYCVSSMKKHTDGRHAKWLWNLKPVSLECALKDADTHINWANKGIAFQCLISFKIKNGVPFLLAISMQANVFYSKLISLNNPNKTTIYYTLISSGILASWLLQK